jgi:hypothetical protein
LCLNLLRLKYSLLVEVEEVVLFKQLAARKVEEEVEVGV